MNTSNKTKWYSGNEDPIKDINFTINIIKKSTELMRKKNKIAIDAYREFIIRRIKNECK